MFYTETSAKHDSLHLSGYYARHRIASHLWDKVKLLIKFYSDIIFLKSLQYYDVHLQRLRVAMTFEKSCINGLMFRR